MSGLSPLEKGGIGGFEIKLKTKSQNSDKGNFCILVCHFGFCYLVFGFGSPLLNFPVVREREGKLKVQVRSKK
jgi:hypothetical protein